MEYAKDFFEKLRPDVSVATSGRVCCYIGTYQMLHRDVIFAASCKKFFGKSFGD